MQPRLPNIRCVPLWVRAYSILAERVFLRMARRLG